MSFWKKLFGKNEQTVVEDNMVVDDEFEDSEIDADTEAESDNEFEEVGEDAEIESSTSDELVTDESVDETQEQSESETESTVQSAQVTEESEVDADVATEDEDETDAEDQEAKAKSEADAAEEQLRQELEAAETAALNAQLEIEKEEFLEDLSVLDGRILPQLKVPDWREELEFVKERYEPCDLSDHIVKVSKRRLTARQIDHELAQSRKQAYERYLERASRRFKEKIDEDALLHTALTDLSQWRSEQGKSVAWLIAERVNEEVLKAKEAEIAATSFVENNSEFTNSSAIAAYRHFSRRLFLIPVVTLYIMSVVGLTYSRFDWIMKFFPFFNLGLSKTIYMIGGVASYFLLANFWRYSKKVAEIQRKLVIFKAKYEEQDKRIRHAVSEHTRLSQQQPLVEPILFVLAKAYRVQLQSNVMAKVHATTEFESASLPACVTLARALNTEDEKMARLRRRALNILMTPGWRTNGLNDIARIHAESRMLDAHSLSLSSLDTDSMISATSAQKILLEAFTNTSIHDRVSKERLIKAIQEIHTEVLANWSSEDRPKVLSLRDDGFDKIAFRTSWLADEDGSEPWLPFLREILSEETAPFGLFNILDKRSELNMPDRISSEAVVPNYFVVSDSKVTIGKSSSQEVMPLDVVVRVDVSPWSEPTAFAVFANETKNASTTVAKPSEAAPMRSGGSTSA
jgi:hypothetical protein